VINRFRNVGDSFLSLLSVKLTLFFIYNIIFGSLAHDIGHELNLYMKF
jgi:hypothetical protein